VLPVWAGTPAFALVGGLATCGLVYGIAQRRGRLDPYVLLLSGVIVNVFNGAVIMAIILVARPTEVIQFIGWGMGHVPGWIWFSKRLLGLCAAGAVAGWLLLLLRSAAFNALGLGDEVAGSVGVSVGWLRVETFIVVSLMTAAAVSLAGPIGFVGLIVPHVCRMVLGPDHRRLAIYCGFVGAVFLMAADTLCRVVGDALNLGEVPVGILTALCGGPFFIVLLRRRMRETHA
jgi:iron complex transport system permease protein